MSSSLTDTAEYRAFCLEVALDPERLASFRRDPVYEHVVRVTPQQGHAYLAATGPADVLRILPPQYRADPVMARYAWIVREIERRFLPEHFAAVQGGLLSTLRVVEIGGGFGGLAALLAPRVDSYEIVDLPEVGCLQRAWLRSQGVAGVRTVSSEGTEGRASDLLISTYAFSELAVEWQERYADLYLNRAERGFMVCNFTTGSTPAECYDRILLGGRPHTWEPEPVPTHPANRILSWGGIEP